MFTQTAGGRPAPGLGGNRLQNGKLGAATSSASSWLPSPAASRNTFAQTLGGQQAPLDLSEFPSLGAPSQQQTSAAQSSWGANPTIRAPSQHGQVGLQRNSQSSSQQPSDEISHYGPGSEAYRFGGTSNQLAGLAQTPSQGQSGDEFPPLSDNDRRSSMLSGFTNQSNMGLQNSRLGLDQGADLARGLGDRNPTPRGRTLTNPNPFPLPESSQPLGLGSGLNSIGLGSGFASSGPVGGYRGRNGPGFGSIPRTSALSPEIPYGQGEAHDGPASAPRSRQVSGPSAKLRLADMTPRQRNGLLGLAAQLDPEHPDYSQLAVGTDLTQLGLDLNRPDSTPLYATFATPFGPANQTVRPAVPDYTLPAAYRVQNVPPLHDKISSMSDEALLAIFYSKTRDLAQEMAAQELFNRDWRWHMVHRVWLQKDPNNAAPSRIDSTQERGFYIIFNVNQWRKERREFVLQYKDLEQRPGPVAFGTA